jgi:hypothetical protein
VLLLLKNLFFTLAVPGTVAIYVPLLIVRGLSLDSGISLLVSLVFFLVGGSIYTWCVWDFAVLAAGLPRRLMRPRSWSCGDYISTREIQCT